MIKETFLAIKTAIISNLGNINGEKIEDWNNNIYFEIFQFYLFGTNNEIYFQK